jgi:hypothetical protein
MKQLILNPDVELYYWYGWQNKASSGSITGEEFAGPWRVVTLDEETSRRFKPDVYADRGFSFSHCIHIVKTYIRYYILHLFLERLRGVCGTVKSCHFGWGDKQKVWTMTLRSDHQTWCHTLWDKQKIGLLMSGEEQVNNMIDFFLLQK